MFNDSTKSGSRLTSQARIEQKITYSACAIVTCFTVTQAPSVLLPTILGNPTFRGPEWKMNLQIVTNCMVVIGKSLNFALFCLSSKTFRQRLVEVCRHILQCKSFRQLMLQSSSFPLSNTTRNTAIVDGSSCKSEANQRPTSSGAIYLRKVRRSLPSIRYSDIRRSSKNVTIIRPRTLSMVQI
ncbi:unnamed protein product [Anisakis simplex]|uniref:G_PROTEIN_RECEP_F1_2 domain-containing protein n=1 Tax=Anisakis simplex TaxID=6269 RepID=A0A0M3K992_ANISI|nr:unnamed protein product [Anisakis simplex]